MAPRHEFTPVQNAAQGVGGGQNQGILIVRHKTSGKVYIEKRIPPCLITQGDTRREVRAMGQCSSHPNIVRLITYDLNTPAHIPYGSLYLQHCELGSLDALMLRYAARGQYLADEGFVWKVFFDLSLALAKLHFGADEQLSRARAAIGKDAKPIAGWNPITHRDIKPSNIFLTWKHADTSTSAQGMVYPTLVLGDFGCAVSNADMAHGKLPVQHATYVFEPPEAQDWHFSDKTDVWGVGLVIHCLVMMVQIPAGTRSEREIAPFGGCRTSWVLRAVVRGCLKKDFRARGGVRGLARRVWEGYMEYVREGGRASALPGWALG